MAAGERIEVVGEITKVETYTTSGGGLTVKIRLPKVDKNVIGVLGSSTQRIADITFDLRATYEYDEDDDQGALEL
jgi:curli biogenesis system outer membrane secretion channel CsgG